MRVCHIVPSLEGRHGGPSKSVRALANGLALLGGPVELVTTLPAGQTAPVAGGDTALIHTFPRVVPQRLCRSPGLRRHLLDTTSDCVHHHSLWLLTLRYAGEAATRHAAPLVISPRGMLSGWAFRHHRWRKRLADLLIHPGVMTGAAGWHATSSDEADDIRRLGFTQPVCIAANGVVPPSTAELAAQKVAWHELCPASRQRPVALFYSRFHRKKRLRELIELWLSAPRGDWLLLVAGLAEDYAPAELAAEIAGRGVQDRVQVFDGADRPPPYAAASLFLLPSHSENFGLVVAEALAAGVPALVTDTTPWRELTRKQAGWCVPWADFSTGLTTALAAPPAELRTMGARGRDWVARDFSWEQAARRLAHFYRQLRDERR